MIALKGVLFVIHALIVQHVILGGIIMGLAKVLHDQQDVIPDI